MSQSSSRNINLCNIILHGLQYNKLLTNLQPSSSFAETPFPLNVVVFSCGRIFSLSTLTREKGAYVSTIVKKVVASSSCNGAGILALGHFCTDLVTLGT